MSSTLGSSWRASERVRYDLANRINSHITLLHRPDQWDSYRLTRNGNRVHNPRDTRGLSGDCLGDPAFFACADQTR